MGPPNARLPLVYRVLGRVVWWLCGIWDVTVGPTLALFISLYWLLYMVPHGTVSDIVDISASHAYYGKSRTKKVTHRCRWTDIISDLRYIHETPTHYPFVFMPTKLYPQNLSFTRNSYRPTCSEQGHNLEVIWIMADILSSPPPREVTILNIQSLSGAGCDLVNALMWWPCQRLNVTWWNACCHAPCRAKSPSVLNNAELITFLGLNLVCVPHFTYRPYYKATCISGWLIKII